MNRRVLFLAVAAIAVLIAASATTAQAGLFNRTSCAAPACCEASCCGGEAAPATGTPTPAAEKAA